MEERKQMEKLERLKFDFSPHDDMLEARFEGGSVAIYSSGGIFSVIGYVERNGKREEINETCPDIYQALRRANDWYVDLKLFE